MLWTLMNKRTILVTLMAIAATVSGARAESAEEAYYRAYYLETAKGDVEAAADLYAQVVKDRRVDDEIKADAQARAQACREELACSDFATLMPPDAFVYLELSRPGDRLISLIEQLGFLGGQLEPTVPGEKRVAISPALIKEVLGIRGAAVAITGFDMASQMPSGVLVFHPGNLDVIRGMIETGLPIGGTAAKPIGGFPTYCVEEHVYITLTSRLVVASPQRNLISGVLRRLSGDEKSSLADNKDLAQAMSDRDDSLLYFCVNAKPIMPMVKGLLGAGAMQCHEMAIAQAVLDLDSLRTLSGNIGIGDDGIFMDLALRLDEGHHNLVFNLFRTPAISHETLKCIPHGAAAFVAGALNEAPTQKSGQTDGKPIVTLLDIGREIFANMTSLAIYLLPPDGSAKTGSFLPDLGAVITVNDTNKSRALWTTIMGVASLATGAQSIEGIPVEIEGEKVESFRFPDNITIYFATLGNDVLISSSKSAMARSIDAKHGGQSILDDKAFAQCFSRISKSATKMHVAHAARCFEVAKQYVGPGEIAEAEPFLAAMSDTVMSLVVEHSDEVFHISMTLNGLPDLGDAVAMMLAQEENKKALSRAMKKGEWDEALDIADRMLASQPNNTAVLSEKFRILATGKKDRQAALEFAEACYERIHDDAERLNIAAWELLTEDEFEGQFPDLALKLSKRSNEITNHENWAHLDTLALAKLVNGDADAALKLENKAIELAPDQVALLVLKFRILAAGKKDRQAALECGHSIYEKARDNANLLNELAWAWLTKDRYEGKYAELALKFSERCNEITDYKKWAYVDTLALANFESGDAEAAVELQKKAIKLAGGRRSDLAAALERFEAGLNKEKRVATGTN